MQPDNITPSLDPDVETNMTDERKPPVTEVGLLGWLYKNLFNTWYNTLLTVLSVAFIVWGVSGLLVWVIGKADWSVVVNNLPLFGTGRYPTEHVGRVSWYVYLIAFLAGLSWRTWGKASLAIIVIIVIGVALLFVLPPVADNMAYPPSHILISPARTEPVPALSLIAQEGQTITFTLAPTTDFAEMPVGFMDNVSLTTAGQIQLDAETAARAAAQAAEASTDTDAEAEAAEPIEGEEGEREESAAPAGDLVATLTVMDKDLAPLDTLSVSMQDEAPRSLTVTLPADGWCVLQVVVEGETGAIWLSLDGFERMSGSTKDVLARTATYGPPPELEDTRNRTLDIKYLIAFSGVRSFDYFMTLYVGPIALDLQEGILELVLALFAGYWLVALGRRVSRDATHSTAQSLHRLRLGLGRLFSGRLAMLLWALTFPLFILMIRGITPGELVALAQGIAGAVGVVTFFVFLAGLIPARFRQPAERYGVMSIIVGVWLSLALLAVGLFGGVLIATLDAIINESWQAVSSNILPNLPRVILDAVGVISTYLIPVLIATLSYAFGRSMRDKSTAIGASGIAFATSILVLVMVAVFLAAKDGDLAALTIGEALVFLLFGAFAVGVTSIIYAGVIVAWASWRRAVQPRKLIQTAAAMLAVSVVVGLLAVWLANFLQVPEGGVIAFIEPPYEGRHYLAGAAFVPESCDAEDTIAFLFGGDEAENGHYAFRVQCGGYYTVTQPGTAAPLLEGHLARPLAVGSSRAQPVLVAVGGGQAAVWWGNSLLGVFDAEIDVDTTSFGFALEPGPGSDNQEVDFALAVWSLPDDLTSLFEANPDHLTEDAPLLQMAFIEKETSYRVEQSAVGAKVDTFGELLTFDVPKWLQRSEIIALVDLDLWGGLLLTMVLTVIGNVASFPIGVALALGRRSDLPVVRILCTLFIEFVRGVPLVTILFMANLLVPLLEPSLQTVPNAMRALIGMTLFNAAYIAETVRGGLQAVPRGQNEAAYALGMNAFFMNVLIILPQALRAVIPAMVGQFISLFKDTSLAFIVGLIELLGVSRSVITQAEYIGLQRETFLFAALIYFVISYAMSYASWRIEESGAGAVRRF